MAKIALQIKSTTVTSCARYEELTVIEVKSEYQELRGDEVEEER